MRQYKARNHQGIYDDLGIDLNKLGVVMLDFEFRYPDFWEVHADAHNLEPYVSPDPAQFWIDGVTKPEDLHVTLRYGLLPTVRQEHCEEVLRNNQIEDIFDLEYDKLDIQPKPGEYLLPYRLNTFDGFNGEYFVLVLEILMDSEDYILPRYIQNCHNALGLLPNLATFSPPTFHVTLGYFKKIKELRSFEHVSGHTRVKIKGMNYGKQMRP